MVYFRSSILLALQLKYSINQNNYDMITKKFGLTVQKKPVAEVNPYAVRKTKANENIISAKLIGFTHAVVEGGETYSVNTTSQSIIGLPKYFRIAYGAFVVEKPLERPKKDLPNCFKYRKGAMVKGYIKVEEGKDDTFFITGYLNL